MKNIKRFIKWTKGAHVFFFLSVLFSCINTYFDTVIPLLITHLIDGILRSDESPLPTFVVKVLNGNTMKESIVRLAIAFLVFAFIRGIFIFLRRSVNAIYTEKVAYNLRNSIYKHLQKLSFTYYKSVDTGDLLQRCMSDVKTYKDFVGDKVIQFIRTLSLFLFAVLQMLQFNLKLTLITLITAPFIFIGSMTYYKYVKKIFKVVEAEEAKMTTSLQENLTNIRVVKAFGKEKYELDKFDESSRKFSDKSNVLINYMAIFWSGTDFLIGLQFALTSIIGVTMVLNQTITIGVYTAFIQYVAMIVFPMRQLGRLIGDLGKTTVSIDRIEEIMDLESEFEDDTDFKPDITGEVTFENVSFKFEDEVEMMIKEMSFKVEAGETVAIVGKTGSGKSTLTNLMVRMLDCTSGVIKYNGYDIKEINKKWLRKNVGIILQEPFLFSKTVQENINIMQKADDEEDVFNAAIIASIHEDIKKFEKGYETMVGERGVTLSGGQVQRIAIARMLMNDKPIAIFDDSLSAVDTQTDLNIRTALKEHWKKTTVFIITHRITTAMEADKIIVLDDGEITGIGNHQELLDKNLLYKSLWEIQSKLENDFDTAFEGVVSND